MNYVVHITYGWYMQLDINFNGSVTLVTILCFKKIY